jgi:outer membrane protein assembly factor BamE (lipoprotein component of BamABCDE complex)
LTARRRDGIRPEMERLNRMVNASDRIDRACPATSGAAERQAKDRWRPARRALAGAWLLGLAGCGYVPALPPRPGLDLFDSPRQVRGQMIDAEDLRQVVAGVSSRNDVQALLGSPSATGTFDDADWYYIGAVTRQRPGRRLAVEDQRVVHIRFDGRGTVRDIRRLGPEDGQEIPVVERATPSPGNERTLLQQLFSNLGRLGPGLGNQQTGGPGAPSPGSTR